MSIRKDPAMLEEYQQLCKQMKGHKAIIRIARKLLRRMRALPISGKVYMKGITGEGNVKGRVVALSVSL